MPAIPTSNALASAAETIHVAPSYVASELPAAVVLTPIANARFGALPHAPLHVTMPARTGVHCAPSYVASAPPDPTTTTREPSYQTACHTSAPVKLGSGSSSD